MATIKCPKCGSYNTGTAYLNYAEKALDVSFKIGTTLLVSALLGQAHGAHHAQELREKKDAGVKGHICHKCGYEW